MADPASYRPAPGSIPESPGVYRFRDARGRVIYVGKAKNLRSAAELLLRRLRRPAPADPDHAAARPPGWTGPSSRTEVEALQLEYSWIKEFDPRFNVRYRDDKSYPYLAVTLDEEYPRVMVMRGAKRRGTRYFGPYSHAWAIRDTVDTLLRVFPVRTCSAGVFKRAGQIGRPCLLGYIGKCSAPCVGRVSEAEHRLLAEEFCDFMAGQTARFTRRLDGLMREAAAAEEYERAARLRDDIQALQRALEKQAVVLGDGTDCDVIALAEDQLEAAVQIFYVRGGRVRGQRGWVVDKVEDVTPGELVEQFLGQVYGDDPAADQGAAAQEAVARDAVGPGGSRRGGPGREGPAAAARTAGARVVPREILVPAAAAGPGRGGDLAGRAPRRAGSACGCRSAATRRRCWTPWPGTPPSRWPCTRPGGPATSPPAAGRCRRSRTALGLDAAPLRIECYDVSNLQGTHVVASMVVFEDGLARKSEYRRFSIKGYDGTDDVASVHEVVYRRFRRYLEEREETGELDVLGDSEEPGAAGPVAEDGTRRKFAYPPNLVVIDGGPAQVAAAQRALDELGIDDVAVCGLAKRLEEVWLPGDDAPVILPRTSEGCTCCSGSGTRRTGSRSPTTGRSAPPP